MTLIIKNKKKNFFSMLLLVLGCKALPNHSRGTQRPDDVLMISYNLSPRILR